MTTSTNTIAHQVRDACMAAMKLGRPFSWIKTHDVQASDTLTQSQKAFARATARREAAYAV